MEHLMDLSHIVVATSLSSHTAAVYAQGVRLARAVGAKITLAHVDGTIRWRLPGLEMVRAYIEERQAITLGRLERDRDALRDAGVDAEMAIVSEHSVWRGLLELTSELGADLIVAGRGPDAPGLGTTAKRLARHAEVPLLLCSEGEPRNLDQLPAIEHVVAATDLSAISDLGARAAFDFARRVGAKLTLAHVVTPYASLLRDDSAVTQRAMAQLEAALRESAGARLEVLAASLDDDVVPELLLAEKVAPALDGLATDEGAILALATHGDSELDAILLGSMAERVAAEARAPVLLLCRPYLAMFYQDGLDEA